MVDYLQNNQPFPSEENEALLELLTYELDEVYKELQEYSEIRSEILKAK